MKKLFREIKTNNLFGFYKNMLPNPDLVLRQTGSSIQDMKDLLYDSHVWSCVQSRKSGVLSLDLEIQSDNPIYQELVQNLDYEKVSKSILNSILYGYSILEIVYEKSGNYILPVEIKEHHHNEFTINNKSEIYHKEEKLDSRKILLIINNSSLSSPYGESILTRCYWPVKFKQADFRFWASYMERFGTPIVHGKYPRGTNSDEAQKLLDHLKNLNEDSAIVSPEDVKLEIKDSNNYGTSAMYAEMIDKCNAEISKAILSQTLTTEIGSGSKAAAETHLKVRKEIIENDAKLLENAWNKLFKIISELNFNSEKVSLKISRKEIESDIKLERDKTLVKECGVTFTKKYWQKHYNFKEDEIV